MPGVGKGWVTETQLYWDIKKALVHFDVQHHASPDWLGKQHLDIYIPELEVALEYQGLQHDQPVEFFGGENGFENTQRRDARKYRLCKKHGVRLIYIRAGYILQDVLREITEPG